ncbi:MAG TPA: S41 family peptidase [Thermoanaerobaculia bacterium]|nr:S41 family peptidase [Thermoanaerobaculia bacterium]
MSGKKIVFLAISVALMLMMLAAGVFAQAVQKDNVYKYLSIFTEVFRIVRENYVEDVSTDKLVKGAFSGVTDAIDEFSYYVPPSQMPEYRKFTEDQPNPLGLVVTKRFGYAYVISATPASLARKAGVLPGDFIERINGAPTQQMAVWQMRQSLNAVDGKPLHLTVVRGGASKRDEFDIDPKKVEPSFATLEDIGGVAYVRIPDFRKGSSQHFQEALVSAAKSGRKKLVIDVRGNAAGGDIEEVAASADALLAAGTITSTSGRRVEKKTWSADRATVFDGDVIVVTDSSTAGSGEVFAAALVGNHRARSVGIPTYGRAVIQKLVPLASGGALYMTIGHYTTPEGKVIKDQGIRPETIVDLTPLALKDPNSKEPPEDLILEKALSMFGENQHRIAA